MRQRLLLGITLLLAICATSCSDDNTPDPTGPITEYNESGLTQNFYANETSTSYFDFTATEPWTIDISEVTKSDNDLWVEVTPMSGDAGEHRISITVISENPTSEERSIDITITGESGESPITISVTQTTSVDTYLLLEKIYDSTGGDNWTNNDNWFTSAPVSEWYGVTVNTSGEVTRLSLYDNNLTGDLDVSGCSSLTDLWCSNNQLTSLDVSGCSSLTDLWCDNNQLTSLDVSGCSGLSSLACNDNNQLTSLDVSGCYSLEHLTCGNNQITTLDVSGFGYLWYLYCYENDQLTSLNVSGCSGLEILGCMDNNQLSSLDVSGCSSLTELMCYDNNQLSSLDISGCSSLTFLMCQNNQLTSLDISEYSSLTFLWCSENPLTTISLSSDPATFGYTTWGDYDPTIYTEPSYKGGYQYPLFIYK